jgi:hypothetical protein
MAYTWRSLNNILHTLSEEKVLELLIDEKLNSRRVMVLTRLHQRYSQLRATREREELFKQ